MHHKAQEDSSRRLVWVEGQNVAGWGCSECVWVFHPIGWPHGGTLDEMKRSIRDEFLDPTNGLPADAAARLRTKLNLPAPPAASARK